MVIDFSLLTGFITLYLVEWVVLTTRKRYDLIFGLYGVLIVVFLPFLIWSQNPDMVRAYGLLIGLSVAMYLNSKSVESTFVIDLKHRFTLILSTVVVMVVTFYVLGVLVLAISQADTWFRDALDFIHYFTVIVFGLHQFRKYYFMLLY